MNVSNLKNKALGIIVGLSFIISLSYSFYHRIAPVVDAQAYDRIAVNLVAGNGYRESSTGPIEFDYSIVRAGPGYEFFLAGVYKIFGHHYEVIWVLQALLHALTAWLIYLTCRQLFAERGKTIGLIAAALIGLHPDLIEIGAMLMTETVYIFFVTLCLYLFARVGQQADNIRLALVLGIVLGVTVLTRPPVVLFVPVIIWFYIRQKKYLPIIWLLAGTALPLIPWVVRNYLIYHQLILTSLIGEYNLWVGNTVNANGGQIAGGFNPLTTYADAHGFLGVKKEAKHAFYSFIATEPILFIKLCWLRLVRYASLIRPMGFWFYQQGWPQLVFVVSSAIGIVVLFFTGLSGMVLSYFKKHPLLQYYLLFAATSVIVLIPTVVQSRYRFQIYPVLAIFAGYFLVAWQDRFPARLKVALIAGSVLVFFTLVDSISFWPTVVSHLHILFS